MTPFKALAAVLAMIALAGCGLTPAGDAMREAVQKRGADVADQVLKNNIWGLCQANTIGATDRYFGQSQELANLWRELCHRRGDVDLLSPSLPDDD